jgi:hypothetical protein
VNKTHRQSQANSRSPEPTVHLPKEGESCPGVGRVGVADAAEGRGDEEAVRVEAEVEDGGEEWKRRERAARRSRGATKSTVRRRMEARAHFSATRTSLSTFVWAPHSRNARELTSLTLLMGALV